MFSSLPPQWPLSCVSLICLLTNCVHASGKLFAAFVAHLIRVITGQGQCEGGSGQTWAQKRECGQYKGGTVGQQKMVQGLGV